MKLSFLFIFVLLASCGTIQRDPRSGYSDWNERSDSEDQGPGVAAESMMNRRSNGTELQRLERNLHTESDYNQYDRYKSAIGNDKDRADYLRQKDESSQQRWLRSRGIADNQIYDAATIAAIESNDIIVGMPKEAVKKSWGEPDHIEVAGNAQRGVERWLYETFETTSEGFQKQDRIVYFNRGSVVGWQQK